MATQYVMVDGAKGTHLAPEFESPQDAAAWANDKGIFGTPETLASWNAGPVQQGVNLTAAKVEKLRELEEEGNRRCTLVSPLYDSIRGAHGLGLSVKAASLTATGEYLAGTGQAWADAVPVVLALPDLGAVDAYNVVTDPAWP